MRPGTSSRRCGVILILLGIVWFPLVAEISPSEIAIAALSRESGSLVLSPIAIVRDGKLFDALLGSDPEDDRAISRLLRLHYPTGKIYEVKRAGETLGEVRLGKLHPGCYSDFSLHVQPIGKLELDEHENALASSVVLGQAHTNFSGRQRPKSVLSLSRLARLLCRPNFPPFALEPHSASTI